MAFILAVEIAPDHPICILQNQFQHFSGSLSASFLDLALEDDLEKSGSMLCKVLWLTEHDKLLVQVSF